MKLAASSEARHSSSTRSRDGADCSSVRRLKVEDDGRLKVDDDGIGRLMMMIQIGPIVRAAEGNLDRNEDHRYTEGGFDLVIWMEGF
ncbi:hypothetical protein Q3G72_030743 [Acer saccharum]|nr:hypothetical protein Q3G72_016201 [Acer saccharum]KAK1584201.1 hypothetical protein Q3G72_030743 [Acer saccharum]